MTSGVVERWVVNASPIILLGKAGVVVLAKERGLIPEARPVLEQLRGAGAYVSEALIDRAIKLAGEV